MSCFCDVYMLSTKSRRIIDIQKRTLAGTHATVYCQDHASQAIKLPMLTQIVGSYTSFASVRQAYHAGPTPPRSRELTSGCPKVNKPHRFKAKLSCTIPILKHMYLRKAKGNSHSLMSSYGETGSRTQNLLHSTCTLLYDAKKMSYR
jgi:hypothetical protein